MQIYSNAQMITVKELADDLGYHPQTIHRLIREYEKTGRGIYSVKDTKGRRRIKEEWVEEWAESLFNKKSKNIGKSGGKVNE